MSINAVKEFLIANSVFFTENEPMKKHTTFKIGGRADLWVEPKTVEQAAKICSLCKKLNIRLTVIGKGSNLLISDSGINGVVLSLKALDEIVCEGNTIYCGAGASLMSLCNLALENNLSGLEFAYGIPASVGGAVYMNAGAYGGEISTCILSAAIINENGETEIIEAADMQFGYRQSVFKKNGSIIVAARFALSPGEHNEIKAKMDDFMARRRDKQPLEYPSAGSTFKRPEGHFAGALIEGAGLKGFSVAGAQVSKKHAGFLINTGGATAENVCELIKSVQRTVNAVYGVELEPEVIYLERDK